ncbi:hypothetical protein ASA1KI_14510 [Opitutales bacterium ASA1]|nr:hypothetical protein ASA1KI_14510 [Opitutales bacterium ASA1]
MRTGRSRIAAVEGEAVIEFLASCVFLEPVGSAGGLALPDAVCATSAWKDESRVGMGIGRLRRERYDAQRDLRVHPGG